MAKKLTRKQLAVLDELFIGELDEQQVLDKYKVGRSVFYRWLADDDFAEQFDRMVAASYRQSSAVVARYATLAAARLVNLTESENQETARKACLDIITLDSRSSVLDTRKKPTDEKPAESAPPPISQAAASKILEVLAQEKMDMGLT